MRSRMVSGLAFFAIGLLSPVVLSQQQTGVRAITKPSADVVLSFVQPGSIAEVPLKAGDTVKAGQVLMRQDDTAEQLQLAQLKAQSENLTQIQASEASLAQKKVDLDKLQKAAESNAATELEVEHARLDVTIAQLSRELAQFEHEQAVRKYREQKVRVERMQLVSPIDGRVERIDLEVGESVNAFGEVMQVVRIDPLWIDVPVPLTKALDLKSGMAAQVTFPDAGEAAGQGRVVFVAAVADAASGTLNVRIEMPNPSSRPAGEHVLVTFRDRKP